ncbi:hypothetical protein [Aeromonas phage AS-yj]|uniref:Uncharacterized protein n=1 Tax=Aeromonas phage AS-yj TaxID=2026115 RepID=A0A291LE97_9CAUD|nr:hypothetical protein [Aeromonas phage AS-yj]QAX99126.1 hypothetical protein assk_341 [Aeromonas phage Assk]
MVDLDYPVLIRNGLKPQGGIVSEDFIRTSSNFFYLVDAVGFEPTCLPRGNGFTVRRYTAIVAEHPEFGWRGGIRTHDIRINSPLFYLLNYTPLEAGGGFEPPISR